MVTKLKTQHYQKSFIFFKFDIFLSNLNYIEIKDALQQNLQVIIQKQKNIEIESKKYLKSKKFDINKYVEKFQKKQKKVLIQPG